MQNQYDWEKKKKIQNCCWIFWIASFTLIFCKNDEAIESISSSKQAQLLHLILRPIPLFVTHFDFHKRELFVQGERNFLFYNSRRFLKRRNLDRVQSRFLFFIFVWLRVRMKVKHVDLNKYVNVFGLLNFVVGSIFPVKYLCGQLILVFFHEDNFNFFVKLNSSKVFEASKSAIFFFGFVCIYLRHLCSS